MACFAFRDPLGYLLKCWTLSLYRTWCSATWIHLNAKVMIFPCTCFLVPKCLYILLWCLIFTFFKYAGYIINCKCSKCNQLTLMYLYESKYCWTAYVFGAFVQFTVTFVQDTLTIPRIGGFGGSVIVTHIPHVNHCIMLLFFSPTKYSFGEYLKLVNVSFYNQRVYDDFLCWDLCSNIHVLSDNIIILADYKQRSGNIFGPVNIPCRTSVIAGIRAGHRVQV